MPYIKPSKAGDNGNPATPGITFASPDANPNDVIAQLSGVPTSGAIQQQQQQQQQQQPALQQQMLQASQVYPDYVLKRMETARKYGCQYQLDDYDLDRIAFDRYKQVFQNSYTRNITMLRRIRHRKPGDKDYSEYLTYYVTDSIWDDAGQEHQWQEWIGIDSEPIVKVKYNPLREVESVNFDQQKVSYVIPWTKENVDLALSNSLIIPTDLAIGYAPTMGTRDIWTGNELSVHNLDELKEFSFDVLERANHGGYLSKQYGGVNQMLDDEKTEEAREKELGPNMFNRMPSIQQMRQELRKYDAEQARLKKQQQTESREQQLENQAVQEAEHSKQSS